jgi:hypothetical protein
VLLSERRLAVSDSDAKVRACAAVVLAANFGTAALIFSFTPFVTQIGLQFWFLAGAVGHRHAQRGSMSAWLLVSGDFTPYWRDGHGELRAGELPGAAERGPANVHLVAHQVSPELADGGERWGHSRRHSRVIPGLFPGSCTAFHGRSGSTV